MNILRIFLCILDSLGEHSMSQTEDSDTSKIVSKDRIKNKDSKNKTKVVLVFREVSNIESLVKDINEHSSNIENKYNDNEDKKHNDIEDKKHNDNEDKKYNDNEDKKHNDTEDKNIDIEDKLEKEEVSELISKSLSKLLKVESKAKKKHDKHKQTSSDIDLLNIPLGYKLLCILFNNLKLLENSKKLENVTITNILITSKMTDVYNKLKFKKQDNNFIDSTGYFTGDLITDKKIEDVGKIYKTGLFHFPDLPKETLDKNNRGMRIILKHIADLKKMSIKKLLHEDCEMNLIDKIIFYNNYDKNTNDTLSVCVCSEDLCTNCIGPYRVDSGALI